MAAARKVYPVSAVNRYVKMVLEQDEALQDIWVSGEISNFKLHTSGHLYFTLKDQGGAINAVMFASDARRLRFRPENGTKVQAHGAITLYEKTGGYQLYVRQMEQDGIGDLYQAFEELKRKLETEGLFDNERKKQIPMFPRKIGIVTSPTGAAIRDILQIAKRRYPGVSLVLYPALVQGGEAAPTIVRGIETLDAMEQVDVIIVGRGGGSIEDLWPFNEETVARSIASAKTPIISAVGHETDFTIADFVSDLRAPTPSAAAELAVPDAEGLMNGLTVQSERRQKVLRSYLLLKRSELSRTRERLLHLSPSSRIRDWRLQVDLEGDKRKEIIRSRTREMRFRLEKLSDRLTMNSPLFPLEKGYAMITDQTGSIITNAEEMRVGSNVSIHMKNGMAEALIEHIDLKQSLGEQDESD